MSTVLDDQTARRRAALAGAEEGGLNRDDGRGIRIRRVPDDERVVAAELKRQDLLGGLAELAVERQAGTRRSGEEQAVDPQVRRQRLAGLRPADEAAYNSFGHAGFVEALDQIFADGRRFLGRLEDDRIACDQRRDDMAVRKMGREIVRPKDRQHPVRFVPDRDAGAERPFEPPLRGALGISGHRDIDLADHRLDFGLALPERLAGFAGNQVGEFVLLAPDHIGEAAQGLDPHRKRL